MAIYDLGTASLSANGEVTGVGTTWKAPLTLIRAGATIVFKTEPVQIYTISEITSDTSMAVYNPNGETVPAGTGYAILAHDGISVQGLAQDVAETLRYYQSNETEVSVAVDIFKDFDHDKFSNDVTQVNNQFTQISSIADQVSSDADQVASDKVSASQSAASASSDKDAAAISAQEAANYAASLDATNLLRKDLNFSDVANKPLARDNLELGSVATLDTVPVANGGTGATTAAEARTNFEVPRGTTVSDSTHITSPNVNSQAGVFDDGRFQTISGGTIRWGSDTDGAVYSNYNVMKNTTKLAAGKGAFYLPNFNSGDDFSWVSGFSMSKAVSTGYLTKLQLAMRHASNSQFADAGIHASADNAPNNAAEFLIRPADTNIRYTIISAGSQSQFTVQLNAISDSRQKHKITPTNVDRAWSNLAALQYVTFIYNNDEKKRLRRGIIAQQAETVDPLYVKTVEYFDDQKSILVEQKQLDTTPMLLDTMHVVKELMSEIESLKRDISILKSNNI